MSGPAAREVLVILATADLARARAFYDAAFGWEVRVDAPVYVEYRPRDGVGVGLYLRQGFARNTGIAPAPIPPGAVAGTEIYVRVDDLDAAIRRVEAAGARLLSARAARDWGDDAAYYADPDGNVVAVARPRA